MSGLSHRIGRDRRAPGKGPAVVTPASIFGAALALWLEYLRGIVQGTPPAIATWQDQSGNVNDASQGTVGNRATITATGVDFDAASSQYMTIADAATLDATTALTVVIEMTPDVVTSTRAPISKGSSLGSVWSTQTNSAAMRFHVGNPGLAFGEVAAVLAVGTRVVIVWVYDGTQATNATRLVCYVNGVAQTVSFSGTIPASIAVGTDIMSIGAYNNPTQFIDGRDRLLVLANTVATGAQVAAITSYAQALP